MLTPCVSSPGQGLAQRQEVKTDIRALSYSLSFSLHMWLFFWFFCSQVFVLSPPVRPVVSRVLRERTRQVRRMHGEEGRVLFACLSSSRGFFCFTVLLQSHIEFRPCTTAFPTTISPRLGSRVSGSLSRPRLRLAFSDALSSPAAGVRRVADLSRQSSRRQTLP
jgi:hypothetical protein